MPDVEGFGFLTPPGPRLAPAVRAASWPPARAFLVALAVLLAGYMLAGRGFAHLGVGPIYVGEIVLAVGLVAVGATVVRFRLRPAASPVLFLLLAFMALGLVDTVPYIGQYGKDALRDAVLWGYGVFALLVLVLVDRALLQDVVRLYGRFLPAFAIWLPICWAQFPQASWVINPDRPGDAVPLFFFKAGDMAVHSAGSVAFLVLLAVPAGLVVNFIWRSLVMVPLLWTDYVTAAVNRGSMLTTLTGVLGTLALAPRSRNWRAVLLGLLFLVLALAPKDMASLGACASGSAGTATEGREVNPCQVIENVGSVVTTSDNDNLQGTKAFRLAWWTAIVEYTVKGPYFWTGKGFGINLADADGFQPTQDHSLRAPHNSHLTALARMGVPGFSLWVALQAAFGIGLLRALVRFRRAGDQLLSGLAGWIGVFWGAALVNTSFDPYLEGPQGGIWFWVVVGLGMAVMRMAPVVNAALGPIGFPLELPVRPRKAPTGAVPSV